MIFVTRAREPTSFCVLSIPSRDAGGHVASNADELGDIRDVSVAKLLVSCVAMCFSRYLLLCYVTSVCLSGQYQMGLTAQTILFLVTAK